MYDDALFKKKRLFLFNISYCLYFLFDLKKGNVNKKLNNDK